MSLNYSDETSAEFVKPVADGQEIRILARDLRRERTGIHALIAIVFRGKILDSDTFNIGRREERARLAKSAHAVLPTTVQDVYTTAALTHDLQSFTLSIAQDWELKQYTIEQIDPTVPVEPIRFPLKPYVMDGAGTSLFGPPGAGKSTIAQLMGVCIASEIRTIWHTSKRPVLYVNLERSPRSLAIREAALRQVLNIEGPSGVSYLHARGAGLPSLSRQIRDYGKKNPGTVVILDSISRTGLGTLVDDQTANRFVDIMNWSAPTWIGIGHTPRADTSHQFGSIHFEAGEDVGIKLTSDHQGNTLGVRLKVVKANDIAFPDPKFITLEFGHEGEGLIDIRSASPEDWTYLAADGQGDARDLLMEHTRQAGESCAIEAADAIKVSPGRCTQLFGDKEVYEYTRTDGGKRKFYRLKSKT